MIVPDGRENQPVGAWPALQKEKWSSLKETVSREDNNRKLFARAEIAYHKILILFQRHFVIYKRRSSAVSEHVPA